MAEFLLYQKSVPVPMEFINKYMISANATYVKVYLYGLAKCYECDANVTNASIAEALDILESDVVKAWKYWKKVGAVHSDGRGTLVFDILPEESGKQTPKKEEPSESEKESAATHPSMKEITQAMEINPKMKDTISMAEGMLKKPLTVREITSIYNFMQWYDMSEAVVLTLLEYCIVKERPSFAYAEKVAKTWHENGVNSIEEATKILNAAVKEVKMQSKCKKMFGIDRALSASEIKYISSWVSEYSMSEAMIKHAYEITVNNTGKLSAAYMNTILRSWHEKGFKTVSQIDDRKTPAKKASSGYELDDMAAIERRKRLAKQNG